MWMWGQKRSEEVVWEERKAGWRRSGDGFHPPKKSAVERAAWAEEKRREERALILKDKLLKAGTAPKNKQKLSSA